MPKITSGSITKYIIGENAYSFSDFEKIVNESDNIDEARHNSILIAEDLATYKIMTDSINKNKWKEGAQGGAIAGTLIVGISAAISPVTSLTAAAFRLFSGVLTGGTSALVYTEMKKQCCNRTSQRINQLESLLDTAREKLEVLENKKSLKLS